MLVHCSPAFRTQYRMCKWDIILFYLSNGQYTCTAVFELLSPRWKVSLHTLIEIQ